MELSDGPPGAEGYEDTVIELPKKPDDTGGTKAEQEFLEHLNSLKIKVEDGSVRCMVERRGRDISGKYIYLCYPCAAMCSGENILQTHISGKKHKTKLAMRSVWPYNIFDEHPYIQSEKGTKGNEASEKTLQKMAAEVDLHNKNPSDLDKKYNKYRNVQCHIQDIMDGVKAPLLGLEYLVEHPPEQVHYEPSYVCTLCSKHGHPRTIVNHMTCFWHRHNYLVRHYSKAATLLNPYRSQSKYREGVGLIMNRLAHRIEDKYGRLKPVHIDKEDYEKDKESIHRWIFNGPHFSESNGVTFEEIVDIDLINTLNKSNDDSKLLTAQKRDPSPPVVAAPAKPHFNHFTRSAGRQERRGNSLDSLSDISDDAPPPVRRGHPYSRYPRERDDRMPPRGKYDVYKPRYEPPPGPMREKIGFRSRYAIRNNVGDDDKPKGEEKQRPPNYEYKVKLAQEKRNAAEDAAKKMLAYHEKNPEKHPLYPDEWKRFWNRRYKEIQTEGKDPSKHDFKPEWIVYWTKRMKELHDEELRIIVNELYRKLRLTPPDISLESKKSPERRKSSEPRRRSPEPRRRSPEPRRRSPDLRRRSPDLRRRSPDLRRRSPIPRRRSPEPRRHLTDSRRSPDPRRRSPIPRRRSSEIKRISPDLRWEIRSPERRLPRQRTRSRSPIVRRNSPPRTNFTLESARRSQSPLSRRDPPLRNRSPAVRPAPSLQTVQISDDELKPDDVEAVSPWNSDADMESLGSLPDAKSPPMRARSRSYTESVASRASRSRLYYGAPHDYRGTHAPAAPEPQDLGPPENIVATLRLLVALEDYLGSIGPKIVDLLTEALKMEKEKANSSEDLLDRENALVVIETAKEKLKGAAQAGLVAAGAVAAVRSAVVRAAATLHAADTRSRKKEKTIAGMKTGSASMPVAGVGEVDRSQIAQQMAAALIAQGKTDVSSEELAQLVDAVVGMAEAKKREEEAKMRDEEAKKNVETRALFAKTARPVPKMTGTASALQMLQSAYDENEKHEKLENKPTKEDVPDAMDGLSDSDLETLLKNFSELSAEEQHSLIAYLKKLEAREPQRVEKLRQYVSAAATVSDESGPKTVTIESDDDDYTVEDVFKSATERVKEDQIRQEMEIVKKSLEETKPPSVQSDPPRTVSSAATDLFALVQASIQSTSATSTASKAAEVVSTATQPRSFGDRLDTLEAIKSLMDIKQPTQTISSIQLGVGVNNDTSNEHHHLRTSRPTQNTPDNRGPLPNSDYREQPNLLDSRGLLLNMPENRDPQYNRPDNGGLVHNMLLSRNMPDNSPQMSDNRGPTHMSEYRDPSHMSDNIGLPHLSDNRGLSNNMTDDRGQSLSDIRESLLNISDYRGPPHMSDNRGPPHNMADNRGPPHNMADNRGPPHNMADNRGPPHNMPDNRGPPHNMPDNRGPPHNMADNRGPPHNMPENRGPIHNIPDHRGPPHNMPDYRGPPHNMPDHRGPPHNMPDNRGPPHGMTENRGPPYNMPDNRGQPQNIPDNRGPQHNMPDNISPAHMIDSRGPSYNAQFNMPDTRVHSLIPDNRGPTGINDNRGPSINMSQYRGPSNNMSDNRGPSNNLSDNRGPPQNMQDNRGPSYNMPVNGGPPQHMSDNRGPPYNMPDNRGQANNMHDNRGPPFNMSDNGRPPLMHGSDRGRGRGAQGGNYGNNRMQDNFNNQQHGNFAPNNFGRGGGGGRGQFRGPMRGRGRGFR